MARTRKTARKSTNGCLPARPLTPTHAMAWTRQQPPRVQRWSRVYHSDGRRAGWIPAKLWEILHYLGSKKAPEYAEVKTEYADAPPEWKVEVVIYSSLPERGAYEVTSIHYAISPRATFEAGIRDVAHQALLVLCHRHNDDLIFTQFSHYPQRISGFTDITATPVIVEGTIRLGEQIALALELSQELD